MRIGFLAFVMLLVAHGSCVWGQSPGEVTNSLPAVTVEEELPSSSRTWLSFWKRNERLPVESAEAAEEIEQQTFHIWVHTEFLLWWIRSANFPPLVTRGAVGDVSPGALGSSNTTVLFGHGGMDYQNRGGGRFTLGGWFDDEQKWGMEAGYFFLHGHSLGQSFASPGNPPYAVPFFNVGSGMQDSFLVSYPGIMSGTIVVYSPSSMQGAEANFTHSFTPSERFRLTTLAGFRYLNLEEGLHIQDISQVALAQQYIGMFPYDGNTIIVNDRFDTHNHFYGGQLGLCAEMQYKRLYLNILAKAALGVSHEIVSIHGSTSIDTQPATVYNAGQLAVASNSGSFVRNTFAVAPEVGLKLKFELTEHIRIFAGYSFLFWSSVSRPGDQVDTNVNPNQVPLTMTYGVPGGPSLPAFSFHSTRFYAHGADFGLEFRF
jgi:Putative beta barrel porin-7 (BBP7)